MLEQRILDVLRAGLAWVYDVEQPPGAMPCIHGYGMTVDNRRYQFIGQGAHMRPVVAVDVAHPAWEGTGHHERLTNPLDGAVEARLYAEAIANLGYGVADQWNWGGTTGSLGLVQPANPSLIAGLKRYHDGCPQHGSVFCGSWQADNRSKGCTWLRDGIALVVEPAWPVFASRP